MYELFETVLAAKYNYWAYTVLMMIGVWAMIGKNNLVKKVVGMNIFQTSIILFYVSIGSKKGGTIPILMHAHGAESHAVHAADYINPLPHVLMLTAIVVSVATLGVALALLLNIYKEHKTLEEDEILKHLSE
ncbi:multicomponent Na+:H+ antiporter subunit C [Desulfobaculum xiamenense]|uniref:Multicomponent Na+:H+ antiporter subunit C n=1 Tax=Desulfobaculum xiamenense TaxID=995050 RepID=A0A846QLN8_9BACT|nr:cation:proton antiporter subunit C [Desulfobaculum xiamenense]NJB67113.1 multicomponent Na+:H+ antiporter subunit C [Desulfobaculum xiamenense]